MAEATPTPRSVLMVAGPLAPGGMAHHMAEFARQAGAAGCRVSLLSPRSETLEALRPRIEQTGGRVHPTRGKQLALGAIRRAARDSSAEFVYLNTGAMPPDTRNAWKLSLLDLPVIELIHGHTRMPLTPGRRLFYRLRPQKRYRLLVINRRMLDDIRVALPRLASVTRLVALGLELPSPGDAAGEHRAEPTAVHVSRLDEAHKDVTTLLRAWRLLQRRGVPGRLLIVGDGPDSERLQTVARDLDLEQSVSFLGWREDVADIMAGADVAVLASKREGLPRVAIQAQALGIPVVASDAAGCRDAVEHERTGLIVPIGDGSALADAIQRLLENPAERRRMGEAGRERARRFDIRSYVDSVLAIAEELIRS